MSDLLEQLELPQCECLNQSKEHPLKHCISAEARDDPTLQLRSDCDEELLIHLKFMQNARISHIKFEGPAESAPSSVRLFVNKIGLDFDTAKSEAPTQELTLAPKDVTPDAPPTELRYVLFQNVSTLSLFIGGNQGDEEQTALSKLVLVGSVINHEGAKRSEAEQLASSKADWLGKGIS
mmetsp:Transcript_28299/g.61949  ORF Transcript_28299/g.61949 Transcript_28299/m.61949 type:complete len:179 (+) Transcript_28299:104-640(+)